jgi:hypothetical protein
MKAVYLHSTALSDDPRDLHFNDRHCRYHADCGGKSKALIAAGRKNAGQPVLGSPLKESTFHVAQPPSAVPCPENDDY